MAIWSDNRAFFLAGLIASRRLQDRPYYMGSILLADVSANCVVRLSDVFLAVVTASRQLQGII